MLKHYATLHNATCLVPELHGFKNFFSSYLTSNTNNMKINDTRPSYWPHQSLPKLYFSFALVSIHCPKIHEILLFLLSVFGCFSSILWDIYIACYLRFPFCTILVSSLSQHSFSPVFTHLFIHSFLHSYNVCTDVCPVSITLCYKPSIILQCLCFGLCYLKLSF